MDVYIKEENEVDGKAYECMYFKRGNPKYDQDWDEYVKLTDYECHNMVKYKRCGYSGAKMTCDEATGTCKFDGVAEAKYRWLHSILKETDHCIVKVREIRAKTAESLVFGGNCQAKDLYCTVGHSTFVWDESVFHKCPFRRIMKQTDFEMINTDNPGFKTSYFQHELFFSFAEQVTYCDSKIISTKEGVFMKFSDSTQNEFYEKTSYNEAPNFQDNEIMKLTLAETNAVENLQNEEKLDIFKSSCNNFEISLRLFSHTRKNTLRIKDFNKRESVFYSDSEGQIYKGECFNVSYLKFRNYYKRCQDDLTVQYIDKNNKLTVGLMDINGIITDRLDNSRDDKTHTCEDYPQRRYFSTGSQYTIQLIKDWTHVIDTTNYNSISYSHIKESENEMNHQTILEEKSNEENFKMIELDDTDNVDKEVTNKLKKSMNKVMKWSKGLTLIHYFTVIVVIIGIITAICAVLIACKLNPCELLWYCVSGCMELSFDALCKCVCFFINGCCRKQSNPPGTSNYNVDTESVQHKQPIATDEEFHRFITA